MPMLHTIQAKTAVLIMLLIPACRSELKDTTAPDSATPDTPRTVCLEGGITYSVGQSFPSSDGCNLCSCTIQGTVACTLRACVVDAGVPPRFDASAVDTALPRKDALALLDSAVPNDLRPDLPRDIATNPDLPSASDDALPKDAPVACVSDGKLIPVGGTMFDGCNTCTCTQGVKLACTKKYCPPVDGGSVKCTLPTSLIFGPTGGNALYEETSTLSPPWSYSHGRLPRGNDKVEFLCTPPLPICESVGSDLVSTIIVDLADPDVQSAFALTPTPIFGRDQRPVDGTVYSIKRGDGKTILVGAPCFSPILSSCRPIPDGVARLVADLKALDEKMLQTPECSTFSIRI